MPLSGMLMSAVSPGLVFGVIPCAVVSDTHVAWTLGPDGQPGTTPWTWSRVSKSDDLSLPDTVPYDAAATTDVYTLSLHDALPISVAPPASDMRRTFCPPGPTSRI